MHLNRTFQCFEFLKNEGVTFVIKTADSVPRNCPSRNHRRKVSGTTLKKNSRNVPAIGKLRNQSWNITLENTFHGLE